MRPLTQILAIAVAAAGLVTGAARANAQPNSVTDRYLTTVQADLNGSLDTKKAAVGQQVTVTTRQETRLADDTELPKGTRLVGHITQVQAQDEQHIGAMVAILFDHAELKDGKVVQVRSVIEGLAPVKPMAAPAFAGPSPGSMGGGGGYGNQRGGMGGGGGGLSDGGTGLGAGGATTMGGGGVLGGSPRPTGTSNNPNYPGSGTGGTSGGGGMGNAGGMGSAGGIGSADGSLGGSDPNTASNLGNPSLGNLPAGGSPANRPVVAAGESVSTAPRTTALPGVLLSATATANASGTLIAPGRNISLSSGTVITLGVITR